MFKKGYFLEMKFLMKCKICKNNLNFNEAIFIENLGYVHERCIKKSASKFYSPVFAEIEGKKYLDFKKARKIYERNRAKKYE